MITADRDVLAPLCQHNGTNEIILVSFLCGDENTTKISFRKRVLFDSRVETSETNNKYLVVLIVHQFPQGGVSSPPSGKLAAQAKLAPPSTFQHPNMPAWPQPKHAVLASGLHCIYVLGEVGSPQRFHGRDMPSFPPRSRPMARTSHLDFIQFLLEGRGRDFLIIIIVSSSVALLCVASQVCTSIAASIYPTPLETPAVYRFSGNQTD